jgi:hypothetical protein
MNTDMPPLTQELLDLLRTRISAEVAKMRCLIDQAVTPDEADRVWRDYLVATEPLHEEVSHIIHQLARIAVARMPVIVMKISA